MNTIRAWIKHYPARAHYIALLALGAVVQLLSGLPVKWPELVLAVGLVLLGERTTAKVSPAPADWRKRVEDDISLDTAAGADVQLVPEHLLPPEERQG